jgi:cytochrome c oxidase subunit II
LRHAASLTGRGALVGLLTLSGVGCTGEQSPLDPAGPYARSIAVHWWVMLALGTLVFLIVLVLFIRAFTVPLSETSAGKLPADSGDDHATTKKKTIAVGGGIGATVVILFVVLVQAILVSRETQARTPHGPLEIEVTGYQWWWDVRYLHERADQQFHTANELHIPVGEPVLIRLRTADVIHSFWIPNLQGKVDMIPGRENVLRILADRPGVWRGQCAEFCGLQHALMAFVVVAHEPGEFERWRLAQLQPVVAPLDSLAIAGERVFREAQCAFCHTIRGTPAAARAGPDLTHLARRRTLAAGTLPNTRGNLAGWILDPQRVKPGNLMPPTPLDQNQLHSLLAYLGSLR